MSLRDGISFFRSMTFREMLNFRILCRLAREETEEINGGAGLMNVARTTELKRIDPTLLMDMSYIFCRERSDVFISSYRLLRPLQSLTTIPNSRGVTFCVIGTPPP